jgi:hypothetical protein
MTNDPREIMKPPQATAIAPLSSLFFKTHYSTIKKETRNQGTSKTKAIVSKNTHRTSTINDYRQLPFSAIYDVVVLLFFRFQPDTIPITISACVSLQHLFFLLTHEKNHDNATNGLHSP